MHHQHGHGDKQLRQWRRPMALQMDRYAFSHCTSCGSSCLCICYTCLSIHGPACQSTFQHCAILRQKGIEYIQFLNPKMCLLNCLGTPSARTAASLVHCRTADRLMNCTFVVPQQCSIVAIFTLLTHVRMSHSRRAHG